MRDLLNKMTLAEAHGIEGLPDDVEIRDRQLLAMAKSGRYRMVAKPGRREGDWDVEVHPAEPGTATSYVMRPRRPERLAYHDPDLADIHDFDAEDEYLHFRVAKPKAGYADEIEPLPGAGVMYRGMSFEEYEFFRRHGEIVSQGEYNIGDEQKGLTYWTTEVASAASYANSFAPAQFKATFSRPCYVVAARKPDASDIRHVAGTGSHEVGVTRPITDDEVLAVWEGRVYRFDTGQYDLTYDYMVDRHRVGGSGASAGVVWHRIA